ncbi:MAG: hypothetical protein EXS67_04325 [Candidatus Margulisbacteria bacterium]|nr:hypothetical protein [Candidatus Margulisiibacteriota bacterium]
MAKKIAKSILIIVLLTLCAIFFAKPTDIVNADLGRHIINGQVFFENDWPITTNYYSYTKTNFPVINHHWASGIVFYLIYQAVDFQGLALFYIAIILATLALIIHTSRKQNGLLTTAIVTLLALPLLYYRTDIRPEGLSYLFIAIYLYYLNKLTPENLQRKHIFMFAALQIFWTNLHIFFAFGPLLIILWQLHYIRSWKKTWALIITTCFSCLINPAFIQGALVPLTIFHNYGYMLAENQTIFFMRLRTHNPFYTYTLIYMLFTALSFLPIQRIKKPFWNLSQFLIFGGLALCAVRSIPIFGLISISIVSQNIHKLKTRHLQLILIGLAIITLSIPIPYFCIWKQPRQIGITTPLQEAAQFFKYYDLKGPIFNNYDNGSYLIFHLYGQEKVFVDNRPEAYPTDFFKTYETLQKDEAAWQTALKKHQFNTIFFDRRDMTEWAQPFLIKRLQDPEWAPVYVDTASIILIRRTPQNEAIIKNHELAKSLFMTTKS